MQKKKKKTNRKQIKLYKRTIHKSTHNLLKINYNNNNHKSKKEIKLQQTNKYFSKLNKKNQMILLNFTKHYKFKIMIILFKP